MHAITSLIESAIADQVINGAAVLLGDVDNDLYSRCYGYAENAHQVPMRLNTVIDIASVSKMIAGITPLLICHSRQLIDLDAPFTEYLPEFHAPLPREISIRELVNHLSGFGDVPGQKQRLYFDESGTKMLSNMLSMPPPNQPQPGKPQYACWNYILLAMILEKCTGQTLPDFCQQEIFQPLGMTDSCLGQPVAHAQGRLAQTMGTAEPGQISDFVAFRIFRDGGSTANAGVFSTALDLAKLLRCYLRRGEIPGQQRLFTEDSWREITPDRASAAIGYRRLGWMINDEYLPDHLRGEVIFHSGWSGQTVMMHLPKNLFAMVLTPRCGDYARAKKERIQILEMLLSQP